MAIPVLVMGRSGSGKTYSLKNFSPEEIGVISVEKGRLPFRSKIKTVRIPDDFGKDVQNYAQQAQASKPGNVTTRTASVSSSLLRYSARTASSPPEIGPEREY